MPVGASLEIARRRAVRERAVTVRNALALAGGLALAAALLGALAVAGDRLLTTPEDRALRDRFAEVVPGKPESEVVHLLGPPDEASREFALGQRPGYEDAYRRAARSGSDHSLIWRRELDVVYAAGVDAEGAVGTSQPSERPHRLYRLRCP